MDHPATSAAAFSSTAGLYATTNATYRVIQYVGGTTEGTGLFTGNVLAVMFPEAGWLAAYKLRPDGTPGNRIVSLEN